MEMINKTFYVAVEFSRETPGSLKDDVNLEALKKTIKNGILEACTISRGIINVRPTSDIVEGGS